MPHVSIVICTHNRAGMLRQALNSLLNLECDDSWTYELVVVDNASSDGTEQVIAEIAGRAPHPVRRVWEPQLGISIARNRGIREARGEWIAFFDDDQLADSQWLEELLRTAAEKQARCVGGAVRLRLASGDGRRLSPICRMLLGESIQWNYRRKYNYKYTPGTGNLLIHRSVFECIGLFDQKLINRGEDTYLYRRIHAAGIDAWYTPLAVVEHVIPPERLTESYLLPLAQRTGWGMAEDECDRWGRRLYPVIWLARCLQAVLIFIPRLCRARLLRDADAILGARCRLMIARQYLRDGLWIVLQSLQCRSAVRSPPAKLREAHGGVVEGPFKKSVGETLAEGKGS